MYAGMELPAGYAVEDLPMGGFRVRCPKGHTIATGGGISGEAVRRYIKGVVARHMEREAKRAGNR